MEKLRRDAPHLKTAIRDKYEAFASWYDWLEAFPEWLGLRRLRRRLLQQAHGEVLEVAVGTGKNLPYYPADCRITAVDYSPGMLRIGEKRAARLGRSVAFRVMDAENLTLPADRFDTVVSTLSTCTIPDPVAALREMARVAKPSGRILLLEHGRSDRAWLGRFQDWRADKHFATLGCRWNLQPHELATRAGLRVHTHTRTFFGVMHSMTLRPGVR